MAGSSNIYNADPDQIVLAAIEKAEGITLRREYLSVTLTPLSGTTTRVTLTPVELNGYSLYAEERSWYVSKLNPTARMPKDMCYSSSYPITLQSLSVFMSNSYGLQIRSGEWELVHEGQALLMDETASFERSLAQTRQMSLRPSAAHPIFSTATTLPLLATKLQAPNEALQLSMVGTTDLGAGEDLDLRYDVTGGVAPYSISVSDGVAPAALDAETFTMRGRVTQLGQFDFTVKVVDDIGTPKTLDTSVTVSMDEMLVQGNAPDAMTGEFFNHHYVIEGGMLPYRLIRVITLPAGLELDDNARLTGWADTGTHSIVAIYEDALGHRSRIVDEIVVEARDPDFLKPLTLASLVDWVELGGGSYAIPYNHGGSSWTLSSANYKTVAGVRAAALSISNGYLTRDSVDISRNYYAIALWVKRGMLSTSGCLASNFDGLNGLEVRIDDTSDERLRLSYWKGGEVVSIVTPEGVSVLNDEMALVTIQVGGGDLIVHRNDQIITWLKIPSTPFVSQQAMMVARPPNLIAGYQWNGALGRIMTFNTRLYGDQLKVLCNQGLGLEYIDTLDSVEAVTKALRFSSSEMTVNVNQHMRMDISVSGDTRRQAPVKYAGVLPPDVNVNFSDPNNYVVSGTPSAKGTFISKWAVESDVETATLSIAITVS